MMKKYVTPLLLFIAALCIVWSQINRIGDIQGPGSGREVIAAAFRDRQSGLQVSGQGVVEKVLPDDSVGRRHQRFILRLGAEQTLLVAHNIDLAPRLAELQPGDTVEFHGEYEWNANGGVVHWTHHDPSGKHEAGWLKHKGKLFQ